MERAERAVLLSVLIRSQPQRGCAAAAAEAAAAGGCGEQQRQQAAAVVHGVEFFLFPMERGEL